MLAQTTQPQSGTARLVNRLTCHWCQETLTEFSSAKAEQTFKVTGLCEQCQKNLQVTTN